MTKSNLNNLLELKSVYKSFNKSKDFVVENVNLSLKKASIMALVGESGSGKTTLARLIAGLETPNAGTITVEQKIVSSEDIFISPEARKIGMVFQDYALFPHLSVYKNITYGCKNIEKKQLNELLEMLGLTGYEARYPHELSGGQQQRVALARALAPRPHLLILDEPFSNLDVSLKLQLRNEIFEIINQLGITAIFVTHDTQDAIMIADEIVVLKAGKIVQNGDAVSLYNAPNSLYVASIFGSVVSLSAEDLSYFQFSTKKAAQYAIRFEHFEVNVPKKYSKKLRVEKSLFLGQFYLNTCKLPNGKRINFTSKDALKNDMVIGFDEEAVLIFE